MSNITGNQIKTLLTNYKDNLGGANDTQILEWVNFLNQFVYRKIANVNPNDFLTNRTIKTISSTTTYTLPTDFKSLQLGGVFATNSGTDFGAINYDAETVAFTTIGQTITHTSGAFGTLAEIVDFGTTGTLVLTNVDTTAGEFTDNGTLTGSTEGSATSNGLLIGFAHSDRKRPVTGFGSQREGYFIDLTNTNITPSPNNSEVLILRYFPRLTKLTALAQETIIPTPDYDEFTRDAVEVYWQQWRTAPDEVQAAQRATAALGDLLKDIRKTPGVMKLSRRDSIYGQTSGIGLSASEVRG